MTFAEVSAALARASRLGRLTADAHDRAPAELESVWAQMDVLDVDDDLVHRAGALARTHALRGYDAVHCASGLRLRSADTVGPAGDRSCSPPGTVRTSRPSTPEPPDTQRPPVPACHARGALSHPLIVRPSSMM